MSNKRKTYTFQQFIDYRNKMIIRRDARRKTFPDDKNLSYYDIRINEINELYPEFARFATIRLKETEK